MLRSDSKKYEEMRSPIPNLRSWPSTLAATVRPTFVQLQAVSDGSDGIYDSYAIALSAGTAIAAISDR
jgi:hypothetical protein